MSATPDQKRAAEKRRAAAIEAEKAAEASRDQLAGAERVTPPQNRRTPPKSKS